MTTRTSLLFLTPLLLALVAGIMIPNLDDAPRKPTEPIITYLDEPSPETQEMVEWAIGRYIEAGLQLPDLEIAVAATCGGKAGLYHVGSNRVDLCHPKPKLVLHEFAHAWDDNNEVDRDAVMDRRGLDHWYQEAGRPSHESGGEQLAHVIAWGLMDLDITARASEYAGQPFQEQPRYLPGVEGAGIDDLTDLFVQMTGVAPLVPLETSNA